MDHAARLARDVANQVLTRLSADGGPPWVVLEVVRNEEDSGPPTDPDGVFHLRISLGSEAGGAETAAVYFTAGLPRETAVVATAGQLQDHAIEATHGTALPTCPGHSHPLDASVRDGVAQWVCPKEPAHHSEPVLTSTDT